MRIPVPLRRAAAAAPAACAEPSLTRSACDAAGLGSLIGRPVVEAAANERLRPMRVLTPGRSTGPDDAGRLLIQSDGAGRIAALSCG